MKAEIIDLDAVEEKLVLVDTEINVNGRRLYFESTGDRSADARAKKRVARTARGQCELSPICFMEDSFEMARL